MSTIFTMLAMSSGLCQHKDRVHSLIYILVHEYGIEYSLDARSVAEHAHGSCSPAHLPEPPLDGIGGTDRFPEVRIVKLEADQQIIQIMLQALHRFRILLDP